jgi:transporter family-2 protein
LRDGTVAGPPWQCGSSYATLTALVVTGQLICSIVLAHFGWVGFAEHAEGMGRVVGCLLMVAGFFLIARF